MPSILVFTPTYQREDGSDAIHPLCVDGIVSQQFDGLLDWHIGRNNPYPGRTFRNVLAQYQYARRLFLAGAWDALITVEHDNVMTQPDALQRMYDTDADIVYAPYLLRHKSNVLSAWRYENGVNLGMSLSLYPRELEILRRAGVGRVSGVAFGCTLFRRHVLEAIEFRSGESGAEAPDVPFAVDALRAGLISMARFDVEVLHVDGDDGTMLHPYKDGKMDLVDVICRQSVVAYINGASVPLTAGKRYGVPRSALDDLLRAGYVEPARVEVETPEPEPVPFEQAPKAKRGRKPKAA